MRNLIFTLLLMLLSVPALAQEGLWQDPTINNQNALPSRGVIRNYSGSNDALLGAEESRYVTMLGDWTKETLSDQVVSYSTSFKVPFAWVDRNVFLHLDATLGAYKVYVNDKYVGYSQGGATPVEFDLAGLIEEGRNNLRVELNSQSAGASLENFAESRSASLGEDNYIISQPKVRVLDITYKADVQGRDGLFALGVAMKSHLLNTKLLTVYYELISPQGKVVSSGRRDAKFDMKSEDTVRFLANIPDIRVWTHEQANLYRLAIKTQYEGRFIEYMNFDVGFRNIEFKDGDMYVNNERVEFKAAQYQADGDSLSMVSDLKRFKKGGVNLIKVKHKAQGQLFYRMADRLGFYVIDQVDVNTSRGSLSRAEGGNITNDPQWENLFIDRAKRTYYNTKNHSSVIAYAYAEASANGYNLYESYLALKALRPTQQIIYLGAEGEWNTDKMNLPEFGMSDSDFGTVELNSSPISLEIDNAQKGIFRVLNALKFKKMQDLTLEYKIKVNRLTKESGEMAVVVPAGGESLVTLSYPEIKPGQKVEVEFIVWENETPTYYTYIIEPEQIVTTGTKIAGVFSNIKDKLSNKVEGRREVGSASFEFEY